MAARSKVIGRLSHSRSGRRGLTLLECTLAMIIVPMAVAAVCMAIVAGQSQAAEAMRQTRAAMLAEALMEQALAQPYDEVENFCDSFTETAGNVRDATGTVYPTQFQTLQRTLTCEQSQQTVSFGATDFTSDGLSVTVTVLQEGAKIVEIRRFMVSPE